MRTLTCSVVMLAVVAAAAARAAAPGSMEITCDVDRTLFRTLARNQTQVTFRLWDAQTGGSQCGPDYVVQMKDLLAMLARTERFDGQKARLFESIRAVIGSDASPVQLCAGAETWLDVNIGTTTITCDFSADNDPRNPPPPPDRRRIHSGAFAQTSAAPSDISARVFNSTNITIPHATIATLTFDSERWDTDNMHSTSSQTGRLTAQTAGKYLIFGQVRWGNNPTGYRDIQIALNGTASIAESVTDSPAVAEMSVVTHYALSAGDFVELQVSQASGGPLDVAVAPASSPEFGMVKLP
jgi:hypothetical protein